jgi:probable HAF family extracellular repeat protein
MRRLASLFLSTSLLLAVAAPLSAQYYKTYRFYDFGVGNAINSSGQVALDLYNGNYQAYLWTNTGSRFLGALGDYGSYASYISDSGYVTGSSSVGSNPYAYAGFLWTPSGGMQNIGAPLGGTSGAGPVNNAGQVAAQSCTPSQDTCQAFFWSQATGGINIGALNGDAYSVPYSLNNNGEIVGTSDSGYGSTLSAFSWTLNTGIQPLPGFGGTITVPFSINDSGQIVGYSLYPDGTQRAALWSPDGNIQDLGTLPGDTESYAGYQNAAGHVVGFSYNFSGKGEWVGQNFFWTTQAGMTAIGAPYPQFIPIGFNNRDQILLYSRGACYLWSPSMALLRVTGCYDGDDGPWGFNDAGVLLTTKGNWGGVCCWEEASPLMRVSLTSSQNPSQLGQTVIFTATVSSIIGPPPDGEQVNFFDGSKTIASVPLTNGVASVAASSLKAGNNNIHAEYVGDGNYFPNGSARLVQVVNQ